MPCVGGTHMESRWQLQGTDHKGVDQEFPGNKELDGGSESRKDRMSVGEHVETSKLS